MSIPISENDLDRFYRLKLSLNVFVDISFPTPSRKTSCMIGLKHKGKSVLSMVKVNLDISFALGMLKHLDPFVKLVTM